ncbi:DUF2878 domain-containing protein [Thiorhodovibrio frisius]|uniref:DUF2878 domain-containing protein n=1 Tax=Thiorhodovibrio frisius TaxID=631362 RepID=H8YXP2_9GAMM|nr:DUF2878 domain-containing protein [Thiorhodovibrio frisius]EIC23218.1 Protein of unknown function (DUF2878) [Thiorhodovibrio frisius]WPL23705.1 hypothetical protein Thiofri_03908 [Thiorhodovibrio frisius]
MRLTDIAINFVLFQIAWLLCVMAGAQDQPMLALLAMTTAVGVHLVRAPRPLPELLLMVLTGWFGALWDGTLAGFGWLTYPSGQFATWLAPHWLIGLWVLFATLLNISLRWLKGRYALAAGLGAIGGPLAFLAGEQLGGVSFPDPVIAFPAISIGWFFATPFLLWLSMRLDGYRPQLQSSPRRVLTGAASNV